MNTKKIALIISLMVCIATIAYAAFENVDFGVRASALNGAFTALADDATTILANPAGTAQLVRGEMALNYARPFMGLENVKINQGSLMIAGPSFEDFGVGIGATMCNANGMYQEVQILTNLSYEWKNLFFNKNTSFALGGNLKFMTMKLVDYKGAIAEGDEAANLKSKTKLTFDLGALFKYKGMRLGVSGQNLLPADFGEVVESTIHRETHVGFGYDFIFKKQESVIEDGERYPLRLTPLLEVYKRGDQPYQGVVACEIQPFNNLAFQVGMSEESFTVGCSWGVMNVPAPTESAGNEELAIPAAFKPRLDIGYEFSRKISDDLGTPMISFIWRF